MNTKWDGCILAAHPAAAGLILLVPRKNYFDVAEIYQWRWLEESGQRLDNVDRTHQQKVSNTSCDNKLTNLQGDLVDESDGGDRICDRVEAERENNIFLA